MTNAKNQPSFRKRTALLLAGSAVVVCLGTPAGAVASTDRTSVVASQIAPAGHSCQPASAALDHFDALLRGVTEGSPAHFRIIEERDRSAARK